LTQAIPAACSQIAARLTQHFDGRPLRPDVSTCGLACRCQCGEAGVWCVVEPTELNQYEADGHAATRSHEGANGNGTTWRRATWCLRGGFWQRSLPRMAVPALNGVWSSRGERLARSAGRYWRVPSFQLAGARSAAIALRLLERCAQVLSDFRSNDVRLGQTRWVFLGVVLELKDVEADLVAFEQFVVFEGWPSAILILLHIPARLALEAVLRM